MNFEEKIGELEKILSDMEGEGLSLDDALAGYERGIKLVRECREYLENAEQKITVLSQENGTMDTNRTGEDNSSDSY
ncbi:MAG: exodeoxyribonuclease VII small subunit [Synergistes sp.]|nr:exodeoxyribonuclease VII small subunit [Synergistes sp.]